ncbi:MAG TPA: protoporphyrinogen oxidase [bacterium]|nr:protoporphyrinogen oxidase [bacterium]
MTADHSGDSRPPRGAGPVSSPRIVIVGAGIAGLAAALRIAREAPELDLVVCESGPRPGGVIATERGGDRGEYLVEAGPDSFLTEKPEALRFCEEIGIAGTLQDVQPAAARTYVVCRGRLTPIPEGFRILAPTRIGPWLRSPLFSWPGKVRMAMDWILPRGGSVPDESVESFVTRRLGREVFDRAAEPMIGTIYTADAAALSLAATMPRFLDLERRHGSVIRGLRRARTAVPEAARGPATSGPGVVDRRLGVFATAADGMQALVEAAVGRLPAGVLRLRTSATSVSPVPSGRRYHVALAGGGRLEAEAVLVATSAPAAARLLGGVDETLAADLAAISYASSASVTLAYRRADVRHPLDGFGFVVPRVEGRPILAASFLSVKFARRAPADRALLRVFLGGALAPGTLDMDDGGLVATAHREMERLLGAGTAPRFARVHRHRDAMPQYVVGHLARVAAIEARVAGHAGLALAGGAYRGVGISDCIRSGETAADLVLTHVRSRSVTRSGAPR